MANAAKRKGDEGEREVMYLLRMLGWPKASRTRAGRMEDAGDIHLVPRADGADAIVQVKNVVTPKWKEWWEELAKQKARAGAEVAFLVHHPKGVGNAAKWHVVMHLDQFAELLHKAGYGPREITAVLEEQSHG